MAYFDGMLARRVAGEPLQYVVGRWGFRSLDLLVDQRVLIPRPETEEVAGAAIEEARRLGAKRVVDLDSAKTVFQEITQGAEFIKVGARELPARAYVSSFNFRGSDHQKKVGLLSGGERNRVHLAKTLRSGANVLLLDEPTNDLDVETLQALESALDDFPGCAVVISHDRWFLNRLATHILAFEGDSHVEWFEGDFDSYEEDKKRRLGADSLIPKRIKFQKFTR